MRSLLVVVFRPSLAFSLRVVEAHKPVSLGSTWMTATSRPPRARGSTPSRVSSPVSRHRLKRVVFAPRDVYRSPSLSRISLLRLFRQVPQPSIRFSVNASDGLKPRQLVRNLTRRLSVLLRIAVPSRDGPGTTRFWRFHLPVLRRPVARNLVHGAARLTGGGDFVWRSAVAR